jgi:formiminotetrahydrofolate cyclodeaminase
MYCRASLKKYLDDLAAKIPAPGGGSAAALSSAMGAALMSMVVNFTLGKPKYMRYERRLKSLLSASESLRKEFLVLADLDVLAFKNKDAKKSLDVPLEVAELSLKAMKLCPDLVKIGNLNLISDVAVASVLLEAGFCSAYFNVEINLKYFKHKAAFSHNLRRRLIRGAQVMKKIRQQTEARVGQIIRS